VEVSAQTGRQIGHLRNKKKNRDQTPQPKKKRTRQEKKLVILGVMGRKGTNKGAHANTSPTWRLKKKWGEVRASVQSNERGGHRGEETAKQYKNKKERDEEKGKSRSEAKKAAQSEEEEEEGRTRKKEFLVEWGRQRQEATRVFGA